MTGKERAMIFVAVLTVVILASDFSRLQSCRDAHLDRRYRNDGDVQSLWGQRISHV